MFSSVSDFLNSAREALREYERIKKEVLLLAMRCKRLTNAGQDQVIITRYSRALLKVVRSDEPGEDLVTLMDRLEAARLYEFEALCNVVSRRRAVAEFIELLPYSEMRIIMRYRYLEDNTWDEVTFRVSLDGWKIQGRYAEKIHKRAMAVAQELWDSLYQKEVKKEAGGELNDAADL